MITTRERSSAPADLRRAALAAALGAACLLVAWGLLHVGFYDRNQIVDTPRYQSWGEDVLDGKVPYRDFAVEYPPGALPAFVLPALAAHVDYRPWFEALMWGCGAAAIAFIALALAAVGAGDTRLYAATAFAGLAPLSLGSVVLTRFDLWPAALTAGALAALVSGRNRLGLGVLALAVAAKVYPAVLLPLALVYTSRRRGGREAAVGLAVFAAVLGAVLLPFAVLAPDGLRQSLERQVTRPLQIESLGSAALLAAHQVGAYVPHVVTTFGSQNLDGGLPDAVATIQTALQAVAVFAVWALFIRGRSGPESLLASSAAAVAAFVAFGKVLSPQFLIWLVPLVPLVAGEAGLVAAALLASALFLTQVWFPYRYWHVVALFALLASISRRRESLRSS